MGESSKDITNMTNIIAQSIAKQLYDRMHTLAEKLLTVTTTGEKGYMSLSYYVCPICGVNDLQPLRRKWLFFKFGKSIVGYACQTKYCPARDVLIPLDLVQAILNTFIDDVEVNNDGLIEEPEDE